MRWKFNIEFLLRILTIVISLSIVVSRPIVWGCGRGVKLVSRGMPYRRRPTCRPTWTPMQNMHALYHVHLILVAVFEPTIAVLGFKIRPNLCAASGVKKVGHHSSTVI